MTEAARSRFDMSWRWFRTQLPELRKRCPYALSFEPSQFELGSMAVVRTVWRDAKTYFPDRPVDEFLRALRDAAVR